MSRNLFTVSKTPIFTSVMKRVTHWLTIISLCLALFVGAPRGAVRADDSTTYTANHAYVNYTADYVPCSHGTIIDVTDGVVGDDHVYDLYGNVMVIRSDSSIVDANNQVVGFVYHVAAGP